MIGVFLENGPMYSPPIEPHLVQQMRFQFWISLVVAKNPKKFFYCFLFHYIFMIHVFFINSISVFAGSFFVVAVHFVIQTSVAYKIQLFQRFRILCFVRNSYCLMNSLKAFKVACGNWSGLNCKLFYFTWSSSSIEFHFISSLPYIDTKLS